MTYILVTYLLHTCYILVTYLLHTCSNDEFWYRLCHALLLSIYLVLLLKIHVQLYIRPYLSQIESTSLTIPNETTYYALMTYTRPIFYYVYILATADDIAFFIPFRDASSVSLYIYIYNDSYNSELYSLHSHYR